MKSYRYVRDDGSFVPGLPKEVTEERAKERGIYDLLMKAVEAGLYKEIKPKKKEAKEE
jgi:hypothetical protein